MAHIIAKDVSLVYPMVGANARGRHKVNIGQGQVKQVGGRIIDQGKGRRGVQALDNININLKPGARFGILGSNGAGKSTLLRVMGGMYRPTSGSLDVEGGYENIILKGLMLGLSRERIKQHAAEIAEFSELGEYINMPVI